MKHLLCGLLLTVLIHSTSAVAAPLVQFKVSRPLLVFNFLEAASGNRNVSTTYRDYILSHIPQEDSADFHRLLRKFNLLMLDHSYTYDEYPAGRRRPHSTIDLIKIAAIQTEDVPAFMQRITGMLPNETWKTFSAVMLQADKYFENIVWQTQKEALLTQMAALNKYSPRLDSIFTKLNTFYGSSWTRAQPFDVALYPVPGERGSTTASPHNNSLVLGVLTRGRDHAGDLGVAAHEISHVLYDEQDIVLQGKLEEAFEKSRSQYAKYAYSYLNEALATACGNGWAYEQLAGKPDAGNWYNDDYINRFAHAIYPLVKEYIEAGKRIDPAFASKAIALFEHNLPEALYSFNNLLNSIRFYTDAETQDEYATISMALQNKFRVTSMYGSYPIMDQQSLASASSTGETQVFVIHTAHKEKFRSLSEIFPEMKSIDPLAEQLITFRDQRGRSIIIIGIKDASRMDVALGVMERMKHYDPEKMVVALN